MIKQVIAKVFYRLTWFTIWPFFKFFTNFQVRFSSNLSLKKPIILVSNHLSLMDPFIIGISFPLSSGIHPLHFMTADEWINSPLGIFIKLWGGFPTYYGHGLEVSLKEPREIIKKGGAILVFPQGKRMQGFDISQGKIGVAVLALTTKTPILPLGISDPYPGDIKKFFLRKRKIKISVGQPFSLAERLNKEENYTEADFRQGTEIIMKEISQLF
jgi:1-acyl-sn-glycerol-3-phosphate acyltransferase